MGYRVSLPRSTHYLTPTSGTREGFRPDPKLLRKKSIEVSKRRCDIKGFARVTRAHQRVKLATARDFLSH